MDRNLTARPRPALCGTPACGTCRSSRVEKTGEKARQPELSDFSSTANRKIARFRMTRFAGRLRHRGAGSGGDGARGDAVGADVRV